MKIDVIDYLISGYGTSVQLHCYMNNQITFNNVLHLTNDAIINIDKINIEIIINLLVVKKNITVSLFVNQNHLANVTKDFNNNSSTWIRT